MVGTHYYKIDGELVYLGPISNTALPKKYNG